MTSPLDSDGFEDSDDRESSPLGEASTVWGVGYGCKSGCDMDGLKPADAKFVEAFAIKSCWLGCH